MSRVRLGRCAGMLGTLAVLLLWVGLALPSRRVPVVGLGVGLSLMTGGVVLTAPQRSWNLSGGCLWSGWLL
jgi:hypothetical protein